MYVEIFKVVRIVIGQCRPVNITRSITPNNYSLAIRFTSCYLSTYANNIRATDITNIITVMMIFLVSKQRNSTPLQILRFLVTMHDPGQLNDCEVNKSNDDNTKSTAKSILFCNSWFMRKSFQCELGPDDFLETCNIDRCKTTKDVRQFSKVYGVVFFLYKIYVFMNNKPPPKYLTKLTSTNNLTILYKPDSTIYYDAKRDNVITAECQCSKCKQRNGRQLGSCLCVEISI